MQLLMNSCTSAGHTSTSSKGGSTISGPYLRTVPVCRRTSLQKACKACQLKVSTRGHNPFLRLSFGRASSARYRLNQAQWPLGMGLHYYPLARRLCAVCCNQLPHCRLVRPQAHWTRCSKLGLKGHSPRHSSAISLTPWTSAISWMRTLHLSPRWMAGHRCEKFVLSGLRHCPDADVPP